MMRNLSAIGLVLSFSFLGTVDAEDVDKAGSQEAAPVEGPSATAIVYVVRNAPADTLGRTLSQFLENSDARVVWDGYSNVLLIHTSAEDQHRVLAVLEQLDRAPRTLRIQLHLLKALGESLGEAEVASLTGQTDKVFQSINALDSTGRIQVANRIELAAIENLKTMIQVGKSVAIVSGTTFAGGRPPSNSYHHVDVGTMFSVEARLAGERDIVLVSDFEKSELSRHETTSDDASQPAMQGVSRLTHQTTSRIRDGDSMLIGTLVDQSPDGAGQGYLVLSASIVASNREKQTAAVQSLSPKSFSKPSLGPRYLQYYSKLVAKYDLNGDHALDAEERTGMTKDCSSADTNEDGRVTVEELAVWSLKR